MQSPGLNTDSKRVLLFLREGSKKKKKKKGHITMACCPLNFTLPNEILLLRI